MNTPDRLVEADKDVSQGSHETTLEWIVRLERRDIECQFRFIDRHGNINSRLSSAMRMEKEVARQFAKAISDQHDKYKAKAFRFTTVKKKKEQEQQQMHVSKQDDVTSC